MSHFFFHQYIQAGLSHNSPMLRKYCNTQDNPNNRAIRQVSGTFVRRITIRKYCIIMLEYICIKKILAFLQYLCFFVYFMAASLCLYYVVTNMTWLHLQHVLHFIYMYVYMYLFNIHIAFLVKFS